MIRKCGRLVKLCFFFSGKKAMTESSTIKSSSIFPFLPPLLKSDSGSFDWPPSLGFALKALARGPDSSKVTCGEELCDCINDLREQARLDLLHPAVLDGITSYFDDLITRADSKEFFETILPCMADLVLRLPILLSAHLNDTTSFELGKGFENVYGSPNSTKISVNLRVLHPQQAGVVFLSQEFVAAILACAFFCLYPSKGREAARLPYINFDRLFGGIYGRAKNQEQKVKCVMHYFSRVCKQMPEGMVSYERKVLARRESCNSSFPNSELDDHPWNSSKASLCPITVFENGTIEDQGPDVLEVDFANQYLGGGALSQGCVQEEIRFMISPELIAGMLFMPAMAKNEAIEITGAERFSCYEGYSASFCFAGDYIDNKPRDLWSRRQTRIVAIDALFQPGEGQFRKAMLLRETNKAFCGFLDHAEPQRYTQAAGLAYQLTHQLNHTENSGPGFQEDVHMEASSLGDMNTCGHMEIDCSSSNDDIKADENMIGETRTGTDDMPGMPSGFMKSQAQSHAMSSSGQGSQQVSVCFGVSNDPTQRSTLGIATGNWGCGAFGGDLELKSLLQWIAASQAGRPFMRYYSFGDKRAQKLQQVTEWILKEEWGVGEIWGLLIDYGQKRVNGKCSQGLFDWILPLPNENSCAWCHIDDCFHNNV